jgi:hypothetical protein
MRKNGGVGGGGGDVLIQCVTTPSDADNILFDFLLVSVIHVLFYDISDIEVACHLFRYDELPMICSNMEGIVQAIEIYRNRQHK